jgi:parallel beta-helix repeat protein
MVLESDAGQVILVNCDNITVHNQDLSYTTVGIELLNTDNCLISNNTISLNNPFGIFMEGSNSNTIRGNNITSNKDYGMWLSDSRSNTITNNEISNNHWGAELSYYSDNNIIKSNNISKNWYGIEFSYSDSNTIIKNNFIDNKIRHASFEINSLPGKNTWMQNYWNRPRLLPKIIFGWLEKRLNSYIIPIPWIEFDWFPAKEPYDIRSNN